MGQRTNRDGDVIYTNGNGWNDETGESNNATYARNAGMVPYYELSDDVKKIVDECEDVVYSESHHVGPCAGAGEGHEEMDFIPFYYSDIKNYKLQKLQKLQKIYNAFGGTTLFKLEIDFISTEDDPEEEFVHGEGWDFTEEGAEEGAKFTITAYTEIDESVTVSHEMLEMIQCDCCDWEWERDTIITFDASFDI